MDISAGTKVTIAAVNLFHTHLFLQQFTFIQFYTTIFYYIIKNFDTYIYDYTLVSTAKNSLLLSLESNRNVTEGVHCPRALTSKILARVRRLL